MERNKEKIKQANGVQILTEVAKDANSDPELIENAKGLLWMFGIKLEASFPSTGATKFKLLRSVHSFSSIKTDRSSPTVQQSESQQPTSPVQPTPPQTTPPQLLPHIMISYNWAVQPTVKRLAGALQAAGYKVWLDIEQMKGSTMEASM